MEIDRDVIKSSGNRFLVVTNDMGEEFYFKKRLDYYVPTGLEAGSSNIEGLREAAEFLESQGEKVKEGPRTPDEY